MSFTESDILKIARLAKLKVTSNERADYTLQINKIFSLVEKISNCQTENVKPMAHPQDLHLRLRQDVALNENQQAHYRALAPEYEDDLYLVPKIIDKS